MATRETVARSWEQQFRNRRANCPFAWEDDDSAVQPIAASGASHRLDSVVAEVRHEPHVRRRSGRECGNGTEQVRQEGASSRRAELEPKDFDIFPVPLDRRLDER
jgi:hypothetical protein